MHESPRACQTKESVKIFSRMAEIFNHFPARLMDARAIAPSRTDTRRRFTAVLDCGDLAPLSLRSKQSVAGMIFPNQNESGARSP